MRDEYYRRLQRIAAASTAAAIVTSVLLSASPATADNSVPVTTGDTWNVNDMAMPNVDTGSVDTASLALQGYGGIRVRTEVGESSLNGILLRGFGITFDGRDTFESTRGVSVDGVVVQRQVVVNTTEGYGRFYDSFTNVGRETITFDAAFGGRLGYNEGSNQSAIASTSSGDATLNVDDTWASWYTPTAGPGSASMNGPSATVIGVPGQPGSLARMGNFLRDPFVNDLPAEGNAANHPAFMATVSVEPGDSVALLHYVATGLAETADTQGIQVAAVQEQAAQLALNPDITGLNTSEICAIANFNLEDLGYTADVCQQSAIEPILGGAEGSLAPVEGKTTSTYDVVGKTATQLVEDMRAGVTTSAQVTRAYLDRIAAYDLGPFGLHSILALAPDAMAQAREADRLRAEGDDRPLLGVPVLIKDLADVEGMPTTGGSLVFEGYMPEKDAWIVTKVKDSGGIILGKSNLAEAACCAYGYSAYGTTWNAFDPSRSSAGSSGGSAVAVASSFAPVALGTQTGNSLWGPSGQASAFSLRGSDGMSSAMGVMPGSLLRDYVGWITQSPTDLALMMQLTSEDNPNDPWDNGANGHRESNWLAYLDANSLQGKVIGIPATAFDDPWGTTETTDKMKEQFGALETAGATLKVIPAAPAAPAGAPNIDYAYTGWGEWIDDHANSPYAMPEQILRSPLKLPQNRNTTPYDGVGRASGEQITQAQAYRKSYSELLDAWMTDNGVDFTIYPTALSDINLGDTILPPHGRKDPASSAAGQPTAIVPAGLNDHGLPVGLQFMGKSYDDAQLIGYAYAFQEQANGRSTPSITPALEYDADAIPGIQPEDPGAGIPEPEDPGTGTPEPEEPGAGVLVPAHVSPTPAPASASDLATTGLVMPWALPVLGVLLLAVGAATIVVVRTRKRSRDLLDRS